MLLIRSKNVFISRFGGAKNQTLALYGKMREVEEVMRDERDVL
jgi:hypothetical protein